MKRAYIKLAKLRFADLRNTAAQPTHLRLILNPGERYVRMIPALFGLNPECGCGTIDGGRERRQFRPRLHAGEKRVRTMRIRKISELRYSYPKRRTRPQRFERALQFVQARVSPRSDELQSDVQVLRRRPVR